MKSYSKEIFVKVINVLLAFFILLVSLMVSPMISAAPALFDCVIEPHEVVELSSPVSGILESVLVDRSDRVKKGQILARLRSGLEEANVELAKAKAAFNGDVQSRKAALEYATRKSQRTQQLFDKKAVSFDLKDEAATEAMIAKLALQQAREKKQIAKLELKRAEELLELRTIRSTVDGIVVERMLSPGAYVKSQPVLTLAKVDPLRVETYVPSAIFGKIKAGMSAVIIPEAPMKGKFPATVTVVDSVIDAASGTFGVRLKLPNEKNKIPAGLKCKVHFINKKTPKTAYR